MPGLKVLVVDSEPLEEREKRRRRGRPTACGSFITTLNKIEPNLECDRTAPVDEAFDADIDFHKYQAAFFSGSPLHFHDETAQVQRVLAFADALFASGIPCFGSCAGLQIATAVGGGRIGPKNNQTELGIARGILLTEAGSKHKLFEGRPPVFDASSIHGDEVKALPAGALILAGSSKTRVQAAQMRVGKSLFWGTQYHPEISLEEIALALRDQADDALKQGFARNEAQLEAQLAKFRSLDQEPDRLDLAWELGLDSQTINFTDRTAEIRNFVQALMLPQP